MSVTLINKTPDVVLYCVYFQNDSVLIRRHAIELSGEKSDERFLRIHNSIRIDTEERFERVYSDISIILNAENLQKRFLFPYNGRMSIEGYVNLIDSIKITSNSNKIKFDSKEDIYHFLRSHQRKFPNRREIRIIFDD
jgi:hypothetical protein